MTKHKDDQKQTFFQIILRSKTQKAKNEDNQIYLQNNYQIKKDLIKEIVTTTLKAKRANMGHLIPQIRSTTTSKISSLRLSLV